MKIGLFTERYYPYITAGCAAGIYYYLSPTAPEKCSDIYNASLAFGAIVAGFMATSLSIILSLKGSSVLVYLYESKYIKDLVAYLAASVWVPILFCIINMAGYFIPDVNTISRYYWPVWVFFFIAAVLVLVRTVRILLAILGRKKD